MGKLQIQGDRLPIFIAAGVIKEKADIDRLAQDEVIAGSVPGSFTWSANQGANRFHWDEVGQAAHNKIQLTNPGHREANRFLPEGFKKLHAVGQWAIVGVAALNTERPLEILPDLAEWALTTGADGVEIDASCPTLDSNDLLCHDFDRTGEVIEAIRQRIGKQAVLSVKFSDLPRSLIKKYATSALDIDYVAAINSKNGVSGPFIAPDAERNLAKWGYWLRRENQPNVGVLSVGGISGDRAGGAQVYKRVHDMHADAVGIAQAAYRSSNLRDTTQLMAEGYYDAVPEAIA